MDHEDKAIAKHWLHKRQEGHCNGCRKRFDLDNLTLDHITPKSKGGDDRQGNLQLLCGNCNSIKQAGTMEDLKRRLKRRELGRKFKVRL